jgi:hypothetical protein
MKHRLEVSILFLAIIVISLIITGCETEIIRPYTVNSTFIPVDNQASGSIAIPNPLPGPHADLKLNVSFFNASGQVIDKETVSLRIIPGEYSGGPLDWKTRVLPSSLKPVRFDVTCQIFVAH